MMYSEYCKKASVGFSLGMSFPLTLVVLDYWLKEVGVSNTAIGIFTLLHWPFMLKFLWGPLIENYEIRFLSKRIGKHRSWVLVSHLLLMFGVVVMAYSEPNKGLAWIIMGASLVAIADGFKNIVLYPYQINNTQQSNFGYVASAVGFGHKAGMILTKILTLQIAHFFCWKIAYLTEACLIFLWMIVICFLNEPSTPGETNNSIRFCDSLYNQLKKMLFKDVGLKNISILVLYKSADFMMQKMSRPFCLEIGFSKYEIASTVQFIGSVAVVLGALLGAHFIKKYGVVNAMFIFALLHGCSFLGYLFLINFGHDINVLTWIILLEAITGGCVTASFLAFLYGICKTGTLYGLLWALHEIFGMFFMSLSGVIADQLGWRLFFCMVPLLFIPSLILLLRTQEFSLINFRSFGRNQKNHR